MTGRYIATAALFCLVSLSCTKESIVDEFGKERIKVFHAGFASEQKDTKVYLDENIKVHWDALDKVSIFNGTIDNCPFVFAGSQGARTGDFEEDPQYSGGYDGEATEGGKIYSVYPYMSATGITPQGVISLELPGVQSYREKSFGPGANTMVCKSDDEALLFKNACGFLVFKLYGSGSVASVTVKSTNGEKISGNATISFNEDDVPSVSLKTDGSDEVTIQCENPVALGDRTAPTEFWFVIPPITFSGGFSVTVTGSNGGTFVKTTSKPFSISRNTTLRIAAFEVQISDGRQISDGEEIDGGSY